MRVVMLGSGTSTGVPVIGCRCKICQSHNPRNKRTRSSVAIQDSDSNWIVIDTGPEFRLQVIEARIEKLKNVLYTHLHADHCNGFDDLRAYCFKGEAPVDCYVFHAHMDEFKRRFSYAFHETDYKGAKPKVNIVSIDSPQFQVGSFNIEAAIFPHGSTQTLGFKIGRFAYVTDFKSFTEAQIGAWRGKIDVMIAGGIHFGYHIAHSSIPQTIVVMKKLGVKRGIITHLSHKIDFPIIQGYLPEGIELGYDSMTFEV